MSELPWHVRPYREGDERVLAALWSATFGRPMSEAYWRWKCKGRPSPVENVGIAVDDGDRPIFQFVGVPCRAVVLGAPRWVMVGADVMTAPEYRRRGVFTETVRRLFDHWRAADVALVMGLANDRWGSRATALGYERYFPVRWLVRPLRPERLLARRLRVPGIARWHALGRTWNRVWDLSGSAARDVAIEPLSRATTAIDDVWARAAPSLENSLVRDAAWVQWRYFDVPGAGYRVMLARRAGLAVGFAAFRVVRQEATSRAYIAELFAPGDAAALAALTRDAVGQAMAAEVDSVVALSVPGSEADRALRRAGFVLSPGAYRFEAARLDPSLPSEVVGDPKRWCLAGGDFDVV